MALPKQTTPIFSMTIPSLEKTVKYRQFLVKEEKALLIAQQTEDTKVMIDTMKVVIEGVLLEKLDLNTLAIFDLEYMFLQVRSKSVGEDVDLIFACDVDHGELNDKARSKVKLGIDEIQVVKQDGHTNKIPLFDNVGVIMRYPTLDLAEGMGDLEDMDNLMILVAGLIDTIYDEDQMYLASEQSRMELMEFLNNLTSEQFQKIEEFFITMPKLQAIVNYTCPVCGLKHEKTLEGLSNFF